MNDDRYRLGEELGHGGLGRVVAARDRVLARDVAVKLVLEGLPAELRERFVREAKLTAQLEHPNIVPVHDLTEVPGPDGRPQLALTMKRVQGRDLGRLLADLARGDARTVETFSRGRLLALFQDVCLGVAFAHSKGVIHRDLKPSNVMIGDFGETLIVDWGLARECGRGGEESPGRGDGRALAPGSAATVVPVHDSGDSAVTLEGDIIGTPAYMAPEQAEGRQADVDTRSDIYALGAILYEVLTYRPPREGESLVEILSQAKSGFTTPPSARLRTRDPKAPSIPPELDAIAMRALSLRREDRFQSALDLHREIQLFVEGVKERERSERETQERVEKGREHLRRYRALAGAIAAQAKVVKEFTDKIKPYQPPAEKRPLWDAQAQQRRLEDDRIRAFASAVAEFGQALTVKSDSTEALDGLCDLYLDRFMQAEIQRDRKEMLVQRSILETYDREGRYRAKVDAPGKLEIRTFAYKCACLSPVRHPEWRIEMAEASSIPWREGRGRPDLPLVDSDRPVPAVKTFPEGVRWGHTEECARQEIPGAEVWIARYVERDKRLQLDELKLLGRTPLSGVELPQGSYRCTLKADGFAETLLPVRIDRGGAWTQVVNLFRPEEIPPGFCYIPGGPFIAGGGYAGGLEEETKITQDVFVARFPVTAGEYLEFLNDLSTAGRIDEARKRQPRESESRFFLESGGRFALAPPEDPGTLLKGPTHPVLGVSCLDAAAFMAWRAKREGRTFLLMHEEEWEKTNRGVDARVFPYGDDYDGSYSHTNVSLPEGLRVMPVGTFRVDESPYGVRDLSGGVQAWMGNSPEVPYRDFFCVRGGSWSRTPVDSGSASRRGNPATYVFTSLGFRLAARPRA